MNDEFVEGDFDDSLFIEWLKDPEDERVGMSVKDENTLKEIFNDLRSILEKMDGNTVFDSDSEEEEKGTEHIEPGPGDESNVNYNIIVTKDGINLIERLLKKQCEDLRVKAIMAETDKATYSIIKIGKQNKDQPLLMYICDAYNRYRIMKRKRAVRRYNGPDTPEFRKKYNDPSETKFISEKCKGIETLLGKDYKESQITQFKDQCQSSINVFYRRLLGRPPMQRQFNQSVIKDSIIDIYWYIFQAYTFVHQYVCVENQPRKGGAEPVPTAVPCQIDMVIIPRDFKQTMDFDDGDGHDTDQDEDDETDIEEKAEAIGDIEERLKGQKVIAKQKIDPKKTAVRTMRQAIMNLFENKRYQRGIMIIDRRGNDKDDMFYCYQPDPTRKCSTMGKNPETFLSESLIQNSRTCLIPKFEKDGDHVKDIGVNRNNGDILTLSFHCLSATEIRVYFSYCGWGTRFFIEDIKYYLPS